MKDRVYYSYAVRYRKLNNRWGDWIVDQEVARKTLKQVVDMFLDWEHHGLLSKDAEYKIIEVTQTFKEVKLPK